MVEEGLQLVDFLFVPDRVTFDDLDELFHGRHIHPAIQVVSTVQRSWIADDHIDAGRRSANFRGIIPRSLSTYTLVLGNGFITFSMSLSSGQIF